MATTSEVKAGLDEIAKLITQGQSAIDKSQNRLQIAYDDLNNIATNYSDIIATIDGYVPTGAFETLAKDEKAKLQTEFVALRNSISDLLSNF